jgi:sensor histidine kinase YesM
MVNLTDFFANDSLTVGGVITLLTSVCLYLWKKYEKHLLDSIRKASDQNVLINNLNDLIKQTNGIFSSINKTTEELQNQIDGLESRLRDLENLDLKTQNNLALLLKDIETIKMYIQTYNAILISKAKQK